MLEGDLCRNQNREVFGYDDQLSVICISGTCTRNAVTGGETKDIFADSLDSNMCQVKYTIFNSIDYTGYTLANYYNDYGEIGLHSVTHTTSLWTPKYIK